MAYRLSRYTVVVEDPLNESDLLVHSAFTNALSVVDRNDWSSMLQTLGSKEATEDLQNDLAQKAATNGYIINSERDEVQDVRTRSLGSTLSTKRFSLDVVTSQACSLNCIYCFESGVNTLKGRIEEPTISNILQFVDSLKKSYASLGFSCSGGDPLTDGELYFDMYKRIKYLCQKVGLEFVSNGITTNGVLLNHRNRQRLQQMGVRSIQVTLDGPRDVHDRRRPFLGGRGSYDVIFRNLEQSINEFQYVIRINVDKTNIKSVPELLDELSRLKTAESESPLRVFRANHVGYPEERVPTRC